MVSPFRASPRSGSPGHLRRRLARRLRRYLVSRAGKAIALRLRRHVCGVSPQRLPRHLRRRLARRLRRHLVSRAGKAMALRLRRRRPAVSAGVPARGPARHLPMPRRAPSRASPGTSSAPLSCRCAPHRTRPARIDRKSCVDAATGVCLKLSAFGSCRMRPVIQVRDTADAGKCGNMQLHDVRGRRPSGQSPRRDTPGHPGMRGPLRPQAPRKHPASTLIKRDQR